MNLKQISSAVAAAASFLFLFACSPKTRDQHNQLVYIGTYTGKGSEGIYTYHFDPVKGELRLAGLVAKTENPSFLAMDKNGNFLYAVNETGNFQNEPSGAVTVFSVDRKTGTLTVLQQVSSHGAHPCHVSLDSYGKFLMVANYTGGNAIVYPVKEDGTLGEHTALIQNSGSSVNADRQEGPHAHYISTTNDNRFVMTADLGTDQILIHALDESTGQLNATEAGHAPLTPGSGPRHLAFAPSGKYVYSLNELTSTITTFLLEAETGRLTETQTIAVLPSDYSGDNTTAEIALDATGRFLYQSNRGHNSIGLFEANTNDGSLRAIEWVSSGGDSPRNFAIDPTGQWMIAANQRSDNLVLFRIDEASGKLIQVAEYKGIVSPVCVLFGAK